MSTRLKLLEEERAQTWQKVQELRAKVEARGLITKDEERAYEELLDKVDRYSEQIQTQQRADYLSQATGIPPAFDVPFAGGDLRSAFEPERPLSGEQSYRGYLQARGLAPAVRDAGYDNERELRLDVFLEGALTGEWRKGSDSERDAYVEARAMSGATGAAGGFAIPTILWGEIIDAARAQSVVFRAGARLQPMESRTVDIAKWLTDPTASWRSENGTITASDATLGKVTLTAQDLTSLTIASRELLADAPNVGAMLVEAFVKSFALAIDRACLIGSGTAPEPRGIQNTSGIVTRSLGTNGATPTWGHFIDAKGDVEDQNEIPGAVVSHPRTFRSLYKSVDTTGQYVAKPAILDSLAELRSTQLSTTMTQGSSSDATLAIVGDFTKLFVGVRENVTIQPLTERYAENGQIGFVTHWRGDVAVARPKAFNLVTGIRP